MFRLSFAQQASFFFCIGTAIYYFQKGGISMELQVTNNFSDITSEILALAKMSEQAGSIAP